MHLCEMVRPGEPCVDVRGSVSLETCVSVQYCVRVLSQSTGSGVFVSMWACMFVNECVHVCAIL